MIERDIERLEKTLDGLFDLACGGMAIGTGSNLCSEFAERFAAKIAKLKELPFRSQPDKFAELSAHDEIVSARDSSKTSAASRMKIANDIRWLG